MLNLDFDLNLKHTSFPVIKSKQIIHEEKLDCILVAAAD